MSNPHSSNFTPSFTSAMFATKHLGEHDYIVVGGGTAGCVMANRLSHMSHKTTTVLLIETGSDNTPHEENDIEKNTAQEENKAMKNSEIIKVPGIYPSIQDPHNEIHKRYMSEAQSELNGRNIPFYPGKTLGGTSAVDWSIFSYPSQSDLDNWEVVGNDGWDWASLQRYFRRFHTLTPPSEEARLDLSLQYLQLRPDLHGTTGPVQVTFPAQSDHYYGPIQKAWPTTFKNLGAEYEGDPALGNTYGGYNGPCTMSARKSRRHAANAYLKRAVRARSNLTILTERTVDRVSLVQRTRLEASGVFVKDKDGNISWAEARKEVILCAGALSSPCILQRSGIGAANLLDEADIEIYVDNPAVGKNLQDHLIVSMSFEVDDDIDTIDELRGNGQQALEKSIKQYRQERKGGWTYNSISAAYMKLPYSLETLYKSATRPLTEQLVPNIHICTAIKGRPRYQHPGYEGQWRILKADVERYEETSSQYLAPMMQLNAEDGTDLPTWFGMSRDGHYMSIACNLSHPFSRGHVDIIPSDPDLEPLIEPYFLTYPMDLDVLACHLLYVQTVAETEPLSRFLSSDGLRIPLLPIHDLEDAKKHVKETATSAGDLCGTCAMMPRDKGGVVDTRLRVYGVGNLRVCDASIIPMIPGGTIGATVYAVAEKAAAMIEEDDLAMLARGKR